jgi:chromosome partitioning protein
MIYAIVNMKGGVGKTTTAVNLGAALARCGKSILVVDLDPQANATGWIGSGSPPTATVANALSDRKATPAAVGPSTAPGVDLAYGSRDLAGVAEDLRASSPTPALALRAALKQLQPYDAVLIDCPPGLGLLSLNAMIAADSLIVPVDSQSMALAGVAQIRETLAELADAEVISEIPPARILLTMYDGRLSLDRAVGDHLRENGLPVFQQAIRTNTKLAESYGLRQTIFEYAPTSTGAADHAALAEEIAAAAWPALAEEIA